MSAEEEEALDRLLFHLENQTGFWFGLVVSDDPRPRARLCEAARAWCEENGKAFFLHEPEPAGLVALAVTLASEASPGVHWIRADGVKGVLEAWNAGAAQMLMAMNERREAYRSRLDGGIVVEGRLSLKRILREMAPDLFSIRAFIAEPGEEAKTAPGNFPEWQPPRGLTSLVSGEDVDPHSALVRLGRLPVVGEQGIYQSWLYAEHLAMTSLFNAGRHDEAELHARELLARLESMADIRDEYAHLRARAYDVLARTAIFKGVDVKGARGLWELALTQLASCRSEEPADLIFRTILWLEITRGLAKLLVYLGEMGTARGVVEDLVSALSAGPVSELAPELQIDLVEACRLWAEVLEKLHDLGAAEGALRRAVSIADECASRQPEDDRWKLEVVRSRLRLAHLEVRENAVSGLKTLAPAAALAEALEHYESRGEPWKGLLGEFYRTLASALVQQPEYSKESGKLFMQALAGVRRQVERWPDEVELGWFLAAMHEVRAKLIEKEDLSGAKESAKEALALAARLPVQTPEHAELKSEIEALRAFVDKPGKKRRRARR